MGPDRNRDYSGSVRFLFIEPDGNDRVPDSVRISEWITDGILDRSTSIHFSTLFPDRILLSGLTVPFCSSIFVSFE